MTSAPFKKCIRFFLQAGLRSLSLVVDLEDCPSSDFRKTYSILSDIETKRYGDGGATNRTDDFQGERGGMFSFFSFASFSKPDEERKTSGEATNSAVHKQKDHNSRHEEKKGGRTDQYKKVII